MSELLDLNNESTTGTTSKETPLKTHPSIKNKALMMMMMMVSFGIITLEGTLRVKGIKP